MTQNSINNSASSIDIDNINIDGNTIISTDTNGDVVIIPDGSGDLSVGDSSSTGNISQQKSASGNWIEMNDQTDTFGIYNNAGSPEGVVTANIGSLCIDTTNGALYIKETDSSNTSWNPVGGSSGILVKSDSTSSSSTFTTSSQIPIDNTIPQIGEGASCLTLAYTALNSSNELKVEAWGWGTTEEASLIGALFRQGTSDAFSASQLILSDVATNDSNSFYMAAIISAASTSSQTYEFRFGSSTGSDPVNVNSGGGGAARFGAAGLVFLQISEFLT